MSRTLKAALIVAACAFLVSLIYVELPHVSFEENVVETSENTASATIRVKDALVKVEVADAPAERERGLSGRAGLSPDEGMLFVFEEDGYPAFWMKDMLFAIDILWISGDGVVVHVEESVTPETYPAAFVPRQQARYALELPKGYVSEHGIRLGDQIDLDVAVPGFSTASTSEMFQNSGVQ